MKHTEIFYKRTAKRGKHLSLLLEMEIVVTSDNQNPANFISNFVDSINVNDGYEIIQIYKEYPSICQYKHLAAAKCLYWHMEGYSL